MYTVFQTKCYQKPEKIFFFYYFNYDMAKLFDFYCKDYNRRESLEKLKK